MSHPSKSYDRSFALLGYITHGHHLSHIQILLKHGFAGSLILSRAFYEALNEETSVELARCRVHFIDEDVTSPFAVLASAREIVTQQPEIEEVFTTSIDEFWKPLVLRSLLRLPWLTGSCKFSGIWIASNFQYLPSTSLKRITSSYLLSVLVKIAVRTQSRLLFFNESLCESVTLRTAGSEDYIKWCPDPYQETHAPKVSNSAQDRIPQFLMAGHHKPRKGTHWALECFTAWAGDPIRIQIVGQVDDLQPTEAIAAALPHSVEVEIVNRRVSEAELAAYYTNCSAVLLPYRRSGGSSGIFVNALAHRKMVIVSDWGIIAHRTRKYGIGLTFEHDSRDSFLEAIYSFLNSDSAINNSSGIDAYLSDNSPEAFVKSVLG